MFPYGSTCGSLWCPVVPFPGLSSFHCRLALDHSSVAVVHAAVLALRRLLSCEANSALQSAREVPVLMHSYHSYAHLSPACLSSLWRL